MHPDTSHRLRDYFKKAERFLRTDLSYVVAGGFWLTIGQLGVGLIAFALSIAFAHFVSKDAYGTYRFLISLFWTLTAFSLTGLPSALSQAVARGFDGAYKKSFGISILWGMPLFLIAGGMSIYYFVHGNTLLAVGTIIIAVLGPFMQTSLLYGAFLEGKKDFMRMALYGIVLNGIAALLTFGAMFFTQNPLVFLATYIGGCVASGLILCLVAYNKYRPTGESNPQLLLLSGHFSAMNILATISGQVDKLLVFHYLGAVQLAVYSFAIALPEQAKALVNSISTLAFPKFANRPIHEIEGNFWKRLWLFTGALVFAAAAYAVLAPLFFHIFFPAYAEAILYSQLYGLSLVFISGIIPPTLLQAHAANKELYVYNIATPIFQIGILVVLTAMYGLLGTVIARIIGRAFGLLLGAALVKYYSRTHP